MSAITDKDVADVATEEQDPLLSEFTRLKRDILAGERARSAWRKEAEECFKFVAGDQWSEEDKAILESQNRPAVTFNRTAPILNAVCGLEVNNRTSVAYLPRQVGQAGFNESLTAAGKWLRDECNAEDEESEAFRDNAICGEGWIETRMDFEDDPMGAVVEERIDPLEMGVNKGASRANYKDANLIWRAKQMYASELRALLNLPDDTVTELLDAKWFQTGNKLQDGGEGNKKDYPDETRAGVAQAGDSDRLITVVQAQYWRREGVNMVATDNDQEIQHMSDEEFNVFKTRAEAAGVQFSHVRSTKKVFYQCFIGMRILNRERMAVQDFQFKCMTGMRDRAKKCFYGLVRDMLDPQRWANKWLAQTMNVMNSNAKGGLLAETDAFVNQRQAQKNWADPTKIIWVKPGSLTKEKIKERTPIPLPSGLEQLMMFAISSIRDVSGVNLEMLGQADREQAASLEAQRRQSAMTVLASLFDSLRRFRKAQGRLMLNFIMMLPEGTLVRVLERGQYKYIPLIKQGIDVTKFDTIIDQAPTSPDQKQFVWGITAQILQMGILPPQAAIELLKYSPYPESVVEEIRSALGLNGEMPYAQLQEKLKQAEQALQFLEQKLKEATEKADGQEDKNEIERLKLQISAYEAQTKRLKEEWDAQIAAADAIISAHSAENGGEGGQPSAAPPIGDTSFVPLPQDSGGQGNLANDVAELKAMVMQLVQGLQGQQAGVAPPPMEEPQEPFEQGEE